VKKHQRKPSEMEEDQNTTVAGKKAGDEGAAVPTEAAEVAEVQEAQRLAQEGIVSAGAAAMRNPTSRGSPATSRPVLSVEQR